MLRSNNIYNPINNKFVYFDKYKTFHQYEEMGLIPNDSIVFVGEGQTTTDGPFIWTHGKIFGAAGIIEYIHNFVNNNATSINAALAEQLAQLKAQIDAEHKSITDDANAALDKVKQDLEAAEEKIKWLQEHGSDEDKIEHLMAILYDEIGKVNADLVEYNKKISAINGIIEETFAKYDIDGQIEDKYSKIIDLVKGYVQEELRKVNLDERIVEVVGRYMESGLLKDYVTYALLSDEKTITSFAEQLLKANETFASLEDLVSWRSGEGQDLIETLAALKLYVDGLKSSWLLSAEYKGLNDFVAAILGYADENGSFIDMVASRITTTVGQFLFKIAGTKTCILIDENGIRHFIDVNGNGEWDGEPTEHSNFFLGTDGSGWLGALKDGIRPIAWDSDGNVKIQKEEIWDGNAPFDWGTIGSYVEQAFTVADEKDILDTSCLPQNEVWPANKQFTRTIGSKTYIWTKSATNLQDGQKIWMAQRRVKNDGTLLKNGLSNWEGPYCISGAGGVVGVDADWIKFIYTRTDGTTPTVPQSFAATSTTTGSFTWYDNATNSNVVLEKDTSVWMAYSMTKSGDTFTNFTGPILWAQWGHDAIDGDGVQYIFTITDATFGQWPKQKVGNYNNNPSLWNAKGKSQSLGQEYLGEELDSKDITWYDNPQTLHSGETQWVCMRKYTDSTGWSKYSEPSVWAYYSKDGVTSGYIVDFSNSNIPVTTDEDGYLSADLGAGADPRYPVFDHSVQLFVYTSAGGSVPIETDQNTNTYPRYIAVLDPDDAYVAASRPAPSDLDNPGSQTVNWFELSLTKNTEEDPYNSTINILIHNIHESNVSQAESLRDKHLYVPVIVTIKQDNDPNHNIEIRKELSVFGVYTGADGIPGLTMDLRCDTLSVSRDRYNQNLNEPAVVTPYIYFALGTNVFSNMYATQHSGEVFPSSIKREDFNIKYKHGNGSWTNLTDTDTVSTAGDTPLRIGLDYKGNEIDTKTISYTLSGPKGDTVNGIGKFLSTVFCRTNTTPKKPEGGSWPDGIPENTQVYDTDNNAIPGVAWHDGLPSGDAKLWASQRVFFSDGSHEGTTQWSDPIEMTDIKNLYDVEFSTKEQYSGDPDDAPSEWFDPTTKKYKDDVNTYSGDWTDVIWRAERFVINGDLTEWIITQIKGEKGDSAIGRFTSTIFTRCTVEKYSSEPDATVDAPNYNDNNTRDNSSSYINPIPQDTQNRVTIGGITVSGIQWHDGIPEGGEQLWACTGIFEQGVTGTVWSDPQPMTDTDFYDVEFCAVDNGNIPQQPIYFSDDPENYNALGPNDDRSSEYTNELIWFDPDLDRDVDFSTMVWRAERRCKNGVWGDWTITRIKGDQGPSGDGYNLTAGGFEGSTLYINYDNLGRKEDGDVTIPVQFHFGGTLIPNDQWDLECSSTLDGTGYITYNSDNTITVSGVPADGTHSITITATIESQEYGNDTQTVVIQVARKLNSHYEVRVSPWFITQNTTTHKFGEAGNASTQTVDVQVIRLQDQQAQQIGSGGSKWTITPSYNLDKSTDSATKSTYLLNASNSYPNTIKFIASPNDSNASIEGTLTIQANADGNTPNPPDPNIDYKLVVDGSATYNVSTKNLSFNISAWHVHKNDGNVWSEYASNNDSNSKGISVEYKASGSEFNTLTIGSYNEYPDNVPGSIQFIAKYNGNVISYCYMPVSIIAEGAEINYDTLAEKVGDLGKLFVMQGEFDPTLQYTIQSGYTPLVYFHEQGQEYGYWWELIQSNTETDTTQTPSKTYRYAPGEYPTSYIAVSNTDSGRGQVVDYVGRKFDWRGVRSGTNPKFTYTNNYWRKVDRFNTIITDAIFADFAKFGSAIISGDYMFSKWGKIGNITYNNDNGYLKFNPHLSLIDSSTATLLYEPLERTYSGEKSDFGNQLPIDIFVGVKDQSCLIQITEEDVVQHQTPGQHANIGLGLSQTDFVSISTGENLNADKFDKYRGKMCHLYIYRSSSNITDRTVYLKITELTLTSTDVFKPNWCVDLKTGKMIAGGGNFVVEPDGAINVGRGNFTVSKQGDVEMVGTLTSGSTITGATIQGNSIIGGTITGGTFQGIKNDLVIQKYSPQSGSDITIDDTTDYYIHFSNATVSDSSIIFLPNPEDSANKMITIINPLNKTINLGIDNGSGVIDATKQIGSYCNYTAGSSHTHNEKRIVLWCDPNPNLNASAAQQRNCWTTIEETN